MSSYFDNISEVKTNDLFSNDFEKDTRKNKINATIGMIFDKNGKIQERSFIKTIEKELYDQNLDKEYSTLLGLADFNKAVFNLFFPNEELVEGGNFFCTQSATGGSALRIGSDILRRFLNKTIHVSNLTFSLYNFLFSECNIEKYPYYDRETKSLDVEEMVKYLNHIPDESVINLQVSNHNPTGLDLNQQQWEKLAKVFSQKKHFAFFDSAYLGYSTGDFQKDLLGVNIFLKNKIEFFLAYSSAKSTLNYSDDIGALIGFIKDPEIVNNIKSNLAVINRGYYSFSSLQGARIVTRMINTKKVELENEVAEIVKRLDDNRAKIVELLTEKRVNEKQINLIKSQKGIYLFLDLDSNQVKRFRDEFGVYVCENGRANLTALNESNITLFAESLAKLLN